MSRQDLGIAAALCALVAVGYSGVAGLEFLSYDDDAYVTQNPLVTGGLSVGSVLAAFTTVDAGNWHPLTWISHMLDVSLFGVTPAGPHIENAVIHAGNAVLAFLALRELTGTRWRAAFAAALFAIHPLRVESVAWIAERKDVLSACFGLAALWAWALWAKSSQRASYGSALALFACSLLSKPTWVTFPFLLVLLDFWPLRRRVTSHWREKLPFFALSLSSCLVTLYAQAPGLKAVPIALRVENALVAYVQYLRRVTWPSDLGALYPYPTAIQLRVVLACALLLAGVTVIAFVQRRARPWLGVGWLWFAGTLVPMLGLVQVGVQAFADRYTYLPFLGLSLAASYLGAELAQRAPFGRAVTASATALVLAACAVQTRAQVATWHDTVSVFTQAVKVTRSNWFAHTERGVALATQGDFEGARESLEAALRIRPEYPRALANYGRVLVELGDSSAGIQSIAHALSLDPALAGGRLAYAIAFERSQRFGEAEASYVSALSDPRGAREAALRLARLLSVAPDASLRDGARAVSLCDEACRQSPCDSPEELDVCAMAAMEAGDSASAIAKGERAAELARARGDTALAGRIESRLTSYRRGEPIRLR